ncbi:MAG: cytochrome P460 family protein [Kofleriaceae bacterium]|nr:cytochrome P460 family protein [Kofleriaceae bacterium]
MGKLSRRILARSSRIALLGFSLAGISLAGFGLTGFGLASCGGTTPTAPAQAQLRSSSGAVPRSPNGIEFPAKYKNWPVLSIGHRLDKRQVAVVVGNRTAVVAARAGNTNPWPNGTIIGNVVYEQKTSDNLPTVISTGSFVRAEFMFKDRENYASNRSGWGFARWTGTALTPYGNSEDFQDECIKCHEKVSGNDWLFMKPTLLP